MQQYPCTTYTHVFTMYVYTRTHTTCVHTPTALSFLPVPPAADCCVCAVLCCAQGFSALFLRASQHTGGSQGSADAAGSQQAGESHRPAAQRAQAGGRGHRQGGAQGGGGTGRRGTERGAGGGTGHRQGRVRGEGAQAGGAQGEEGEGGREGREAREVPHPALPVT